jgi:hypothetical protein
MPRTGVIQLIGLCDGWVGLQDEKTPFIVGQNFDVDDMPLDVVLEMKPTFDAIVRVVDKNGKPVQGVTVASSPNQLLQKAGSTFLGHRMDSVVGLREQLKAKPGSSHEQGNNAYQGVSDMDGKLTIRNLPRENRLSQRFLAWSEQDKTIKVKDDATGKLPQADEKQVEFDLVIEYK